MSPDQAEKLRAILARVNRRYRPGVVEYYESFFPDRWADAHALLDEATQSGDAIRISHQLALFEANCVDLINTFAANLQRRLL